MFTSVCLRWCLTDFHWLFSLSRGERLSQRWGGVVPVNVQLWWDVKGAQRASFRPGLNALKPLTLFSGSITNRSSIRRLQRALSFRSRRSKNALNQVKRTHSASFSIIHLQRKVSHSRDENHQVHLEHLQQSVGVHVTAAGFHPFLHSGQNTGADEVLWVIRGNLVLKHWVINT